MEDHVRESGKSGILGFGIRNTAQELPESGGGVGGGVSRGSNEPPLLVNDGGLKTQAVNFQLLANSEGMENKL